MNISLITNLIRKLIARPRVKTAAKLLIGCVFILILSVAFSNLWIIRTAKGRVYSNIDEIPANNVGLLLGTSKRSINNRTNLYFKTRIKAAADLYKAGKIKHILVSGDNHAKEYDESSDMQEALMAQGVPKEAITLDYAGFRTLDSIVRSKEIFGQTKLTIISQEFHNHRAVFIADHYGIEAVAFNAKGFTGPVTTAMLIRESLARFKAVLDLYVLQKEPRFLGKPVVLPVN